MKIALNTVMIVSQYNYDLNANMVYTHDGYYHQFNVGSKSLKLFVFEIYDFRTNFK